MTKVEWTDPNVRKPAGYRPVLLLLKSGDIIEGFYANHPSHDPQLDFFLDLGDIQSDLKNEDVLGWYKLQSVDDKPKKKAWYNMWEDELRHALYWEKKYSWEEAYGFSFEELMEKAKKYFPHSKKS